MRATVATTENPSKKISITTPDHSSRMTTRREGMGDCSSTTGGSGATSTGRCGATA